MVLQGLKPRIFDKLNKHGKRWATELPSVLWSLRTMPSRAIGFTPFFLVYRSEAMLPTDIEYGSPRLKAYNERNNDAAREDALDQLEEAWDVALLHSARYQYGLRRYHDRHVRKRDSTSVTWCYGGARTPRDGTNSRHHGKDHTSSQKY
jgi:hypothetical protein